MFIFPKSKWDPGDIILHSTLSLTSVAAGNQLARSSGFTGPANSCSFSLLYNILSWAALLSGGHYLKKKLLEKKQNGSISAFCFSRSRLFQQQQQTGMCWLPTYRLHKLKCADKLLTMATRIKKKRSRGKCELCV